MRVTHQKTILLNGIFFRVCVNGGAKIDPPPQLTSWKCQTSVRCTWLHLVRETKQKSRYGNYPDLHPLFSDVP
jgi:hypothetical protein